MAERPAFTDIQLRFTAHIRDPDRVPPPADVDDRRMAVYRDLLYSNVAGFIEGAFPVLRSLYEDAAWQRLVRGFFARHRCRTPLFLEISQEFLRYLEAEYTPSDADPPFLWELAHYEWVGLALSVAEEEPDWTGIDTDADLLETMPVVSPLAWPLRYRFPVHRISQDFRPTQSGAEPTYLLVWRDGDDTVRFDKINDVTARLLSLLRGAGTAARGRDLLERIARELRHPEPELVMASGREILAALRARGVILGGRGR